MPKCQEQSNIESQGRVLEQAKQRFQQWRRNKSHREPIPEELWDLAVELTSRCGISQVARELSLNFSALKKRMIGKAENTRDTMDKPGSFVELNMLADGVNLPLSSVCVMELTRVDGANLKIYSAMGVQVDILRICEQFLKG
jgi:hypothetical protein